MLTAGTQRERALLSLARVLAAAYQGSAASRQGLATARKLLQQPAPSQDVPYLQRLCLALGLGTGAATVLALGGPSDQAGSEEGGKGPAVHGATDSFVAHVKAGVEHATEATASLLRNALSSLRGSADDVSDTQKHGTSASPAPSLLSTGGLSHAAAQWLAQWCSRPERREAAVALGGTRLLDWLLAAACEDPGHTQAAAERALAGLLGSATTAAAVLERPGAVPQLLLHLSSGKAGEELGPALEAALGPGGAALAQPASLPDLVEAMKLLSGRHGLLVQRLAACALAAWAEGSSANLARLANLGLGEAAAAVAHATSGRSEQAALDLQWELVRLMRAQARGMPGLERQAREAGLGLQAQRAQAEARDRVLAASIRQLLYITADACVQGDEDLAAYALNSACMCLAAGGPLAEAAAREGNMLPLMTRLATGSSRIIRRELVGAVELLARRGLLLQPSDTHPATANDRTATATSTSASHAHQRGQRRGAQLTAQQQQNSGKPPTLVKLGSGSGSSGLDLNVDLGPTSSGVVTFWRDWLLGLLLNRDPLAPASGSMPAPGFRSRFGAVAQARPAGPMGHGSKSPMTKPVGEACDDEGVAGDEAAQALRDGCAKALLALSSTPGIPGLQVAHYWLAALLDSIASRVAPYSALVYMDAGQPGRLAMAADAAADARGSGAGGRGGGGSGSGGSDGSSDAERESMLMSVLLANAVPVLPSYVKTVSSALQAASDAVVADVSSSVADLPADFDLQMQMAAASGYSRQSLWEAYQAAARVVDLALAERRVCEALETLAALVAGDPARQRWLLARGALPLLQRLCLMAPAMPGGGGSGGGGGGGPGAEQLRGLMAGLTKVAPLGVACEGEECGSQARDVYNDHDGSTQLCLRRQAARLLSLLSLQPASWPALLGPASPWPAWLREAAATSDCRLASQATKALLHMQIAEAAAATGSAGGGSGAAGSGTAAGVAGLAAATAAAQAQAQAGLAPPVFLDHVHLLNPKARHHWTLAAKARERQREVGCGVGAWIAEATAAMSSSGERDAATATATAPQARRPFQQTRRQLMLPRQLRPRTWWQEDDAWGPDMGLPHVEHSAAGSSDGGGGSEAVADALGVEGPDEEPEIDVVFIHGVRGGPFITWRRPEVFTRGGAAAHLALEACWPHAWLARDMPGARLLSVEYRAPVSGWEGESLPVEATVRQVLDQLVAAGVGQRPVVLVVHSMGGLLAKEMMVQAQAQEEGSPHHSLLSQVKGVVFYATPHFGSSLASMGWKLRHVPYAAPAPCLAKLTPGPHLVALNEALGAMHKEGKLQVLSFMEGRPTQLASVLPKIEVVPPQSANPGFGEALLLEDRDHITVCKPLSRDDVSYSRLTAMLQDVASQERERRQAQHMSLAEQVVQAVQAKIERVEAAAAGSGGVGSGHAAALAGAMDGSSGGSAGAGQEESMGSRALSAAAAAAAAASAGVAGCAGRVAVAVA